MLNKLITLCSLTVAPIAFAHPDHAEATAANVAQTAPDFGDVEMEVVDDFLVIRSHDLPKHETGDFPNRGNPNAISAQSFTFKVPLEPQRLDKPMEYHGYEFGVAINGVPFDPATGESWQGDRRWREEAIMASGKTELGIDQSNAHVQPTGKYHYHGIPEGLIAELREKDPKAGVNEPLLIGWAADGYPIYFQEGIRSSWQLKKEDRVSPPDGPGGKPDGQYTRDYEYVANSGDLDWLNGRYGSTDEYPDGIYQYYVTEEFPFAPRYFLAVPDESFNKRMNGQANHGGMRGPMGGGGPQGGGNGQPGGMRPPPRSMW